MLLAQTRTRVMERRLREVEQLPSETAADVLKLPVGESSDLLDTEPETQDEET